MQDEDVIVMDFTVRPADEQEEFLSMTWCNTCQEMDLGMDEAREFKTESLWWIEGRCRRCGDKVITEIQEEDE